MDSRPKKRAQLLFKNLEESKTDQLGHEMMLKEESQSFKQSAFSVSSGDEQLEANNRTVKHLERGKPVNTQDDGSVLSREKSAFQTEQGGRAAFSMTAIRPVSPAPLSCSEEDSEPGTNASVFSGNEMSNVRGFHPGSGGSFRNKPDTSGPKLRPLSPFLNPDPVTFAQVISALPISACSGEAVEHVSLELPSQTGRE